MNFCIEMETGTGKTYVYLKNNYGIKQEIWVQKKTDMK